MLTRPFVIWLPLALAAIAGCRTADSVDAIVVPMHAIPYDLHDKVKVLIDLDRQQVARRDMGPAGKLQLRRTGKWEFFADLNGNGRADAGEPAVNATQGERTIKLPWHSGGLAFDYAMEVESIADEGIRFSAQACLSGDFQGMPFRVADTDLDGRFGTAGDLAVFGADGVPQPFSRIISLNGKLWRLEPRDAGASIAWTPETASGCLVQATCGTGTGMAPTQIRVVVKHTTLPLVAQLESGKTARLLPGNYQVVRSELHFNDGGRDVGLMGVNLGQITIPAGKIETMLALGGPLTLSFTAAKLPDGKIEISKPELVGVAGEGYLPLLGGYSFSERAQAKPEIFAVGGGREVPLGSLEYG
jgi:hypothetical protein